MLGLVGESGQAKRRSRCVVGLCPSRTRNQGRKVIVDGVDAIQLSNRALRSFRGGTVAYVPQDPGSALNPALRVGTQLREAFRAHSTGKEDAETRIDAVLEEVNLPTSLGYLDRYPHQLSGGQQQRVSLALAFLWRPTLIVLDEPTTGLDVSTQRHILGTVRNLCMSYGVAGVFVSHDLAVVSGLASTVAVMYAGRIVEFGDTGQVFGEPAHPYTRGLLDALPSPTRTERLLGIDGQPPQPGRRPRGCSFAPRCPLRMAVCDSDAPPASNVNDRLVRCWRGGETRAMAAAPAGSHALNLGRDEILRIRDLSAKYGDNVVLHDVSFDVPANSCVAIVGESGSGKTTLAGCIAGLHTDFIGSLEFRGTRLAPGTTERARPMLRAIQYVFQNPYTSLNPRKTIGQIITQPLEHHFELSRSERQARATRSWTTLSFPGTSCRGSLTNYPAGSDSE